MDEKQFLQNQLTELKASVEGHKVIVQNAINAAGENKQGIKALHKRVDEMSEMLILLNDNQLSKNEIIEIMQNSVNGNIAKGFKAVGMAILVGVGGWIVTGMQGLWK